MKGNPPTNAQLHFNHWSPGKNALSAPEHVYSRRLGPDVWLVDGAYIRDRIDIDFCLGGSWARYAYVPAGEIWIEATTVPEEWAAVIAHERTEAEHMRRGVGYEAAHQAANDVEAKIRRTDATQGAMNVTAR